METKNSNEKKYEKLEDFNLIYIADVVKEEIPKTIIGNLIKRYPEKVIKKKLFRKKMIYNPELSEEVIQRFKYGENMVVIDGIVYRKFVDSDKGEVYYDGSYDMTSIVKEALDTPEIKETLQFLKKNIGNPVVSKELLKLSGFKPISKESYKVFLFLKEQEPKSKNLRSSKICLSIVKGESEFTLDLGFLNYYVYGRRAMI
ncbi:MAG: hypothetical protein QXW97_02855 [Candidatus Pacearchaeota archaeon]